jgi:hypothetical protein
VISGCIPSQNFFLAAHTKKVLALRSIRKIKNGLDLKGA